MRRPAAIAAAIGVATIALLALLTGLGGFTPWVAHAEPPATSDDPPLPRPHLGYGLNVRLEEHIDPLFAPLGMEWIKLWEEYELAPPAERLPYQVLFAFDLREGMPPDIDAWATYVEAVARAGRGRVEAYEIGNEPNVERFWGGRPPDPAEYTQVLQAAYERIKAVDPAAIVVSGGLAPVGRIEGQCNGWEGNNCGAMDEREYTRQMLLSGAGDYLDAFGYHPYGFAYEPETAPQTVENGFAFRGVEIIHDILAQHGLAHKPIWATEFNWLRDWRADGATMPEDCRQTYADHFGWMEVTEVEQANYITRAYRYADENWPWMGAMFIWNLDWHNYHTWDCEAAHYFSIRKRDDTVTGAPSLAYHTVMSMEKRVGYFGPQLAITPTALNLEANVYEPGVVTATLTPWNARYRLLTWTASAATAAATSAATSAAITPTLAITTGRQGNPLTISVDSAGYAVGVYTTAVTLTAFPSETLDSPQTAPITLHVRGAELEIVPPTIDIQAALNEPGVHTAVVAPINTGYGVFTWTASVASGFQLTGTLGTLGAQMTPTLAVTTGLQGQPLTVTVDTTGYSSGTFVGAITVTTIPSDVLNAPQRATISMRIVSERRRIFLPLIMRTES